MQFVINSIIILIGMSSCVGYKLGNNKPAHLQKVNSVTAARVGVGTMSGSCAGSGPGAGFGHRPHDNGQK